MPKQALGGIPLDFGIVMEDKPSELSCSYLTSSSVLGGLIIPADWVRLSLSMARFFVSVSLLCLSPMPQAWGSSFNLRQD